MVEVVLPSGTFTPYIRFFTGIITVLFMLMMGKGISVTEIWPSFEAIQTIDLDAIEEQADLRVATLLQERIAEDILANIPECVEVRSVQTDSSGAVSRMELVVNQPVSREKIQKRYGVLKDHIVLRGAGEP